MKKPKDFSTLAPSPWTVETDEGAFRSLPGATILDEGMDWVVELHGPLEQKRPSESKNKSRINLRKFVPEPSPPSPLEGRDGQHVSSDFEKKLQQTLASLMDEGGGEAVFREAARLAAMRGVPVESIVLSRTDFVGSATTTTRRKEVVSEPAPPESHAPIKSTPRRAHVILPELPEGLSWPTARYKKHSGIVDFLTNSGWKELIAAGYGELRFLRKLDPHAATAVSAYESPHKETGVRRRLPQDLQFLRERDITDRKILSKGAQALSTDSHLAAAVAARLARGSKMPKFR